MKHCYYSIAAAYLLNLFLSVDTVKAQIIPLNSQENQQNSIPLSPSNSEPETSIKVGEVVVTGVEGALQQEAYKAISTQAGKTITSSQLQKDTNAIFATGYFANVRAITEETTAGVRVIFYVQPNPVLHSVRLKGNQVLPTNVVNDAFSSQYGNVLNSQQLREGIKKLNQWYQDNCYVLGQILDNPSISSDGTVTLQVAEGVVEDIQVRFVNEEGQDTDAEGKPIKGRTQQYIIKREMALKPGTIFNRDTVQKDLQRIAGLGIFRDLNLSLTPGKDPRQVIVVVNVSESKTFSVTPQGGYSSVNGFYGGASFQAGNLSGINQKLQGNAEFNQRGLQFDASFSDPWIAGDPYRTSYTVNGFRRQATSQIFEGGDTDVKLPNGDKPRVYRTGGGINFTRPLSKDPLTKSEWFATAGLRYQQVSIRDADGNVSPKDQLGNNLSFSNSGNDDLLTVPLGLVQDSRNNSLQPTQGSFLSLTTEQSIPIGESNLLYNKLQGGYRFYLPTRLTQFTQGCRKSVANNNTKTQECPQAFAFQLQGGTVLGDLPPYEAFSLGGTNSVRGFEEGGLGTARTFVQASAEYRFPMLSFLGGALFFDAATDFGTGSSVVGNPAGVRGKAGSGFAYGAGVRVQTPVGPFRIDYGVTNEGENRVNFGIGERF